MAQELVGASGLVALYVPEGTGEAYWPEMRRGRVISAVKLVPMPEDQHIEDYFSNDLDGSCRWPIGWPCRVVYAPPATECRSLREHVESEYEPGAFRSYLRRLHL